MAEKLTIKINGDVKNFQDKLQEVTGETQALQDTLSSVAKRSAVAFAGLTAAIGGSIAAYRTQEQAEIRTRQTIKATGQAAGLTAEEIFNMASQLQKVTTFGDETIISGQNLLLTFRNIGKDTFPRATEALLDMSTAMGTDLKSSAIQLGKALNDPTAGITALTRTGITFTEQQKEQIKFLQETGDVAGAQAIILKELEMQFGGTAKAAAEGTGSFIQLKNEVGDLVEQLGKQFLPMVSGGVKQLKVFFERIKENEEAVKALAKIIAMGAVLTGLATGLATAGVALLKFRGILAATRLAVQGMTTSVKLLIGSTGLGLIVAFAPEIISAAKGIWDAISGGSDAKEAPKNIKEIEKNLDGLKEKEKELVGFIEERNGRMAAGAKEQLARLQKEIASVEQVRAKLLEEEQARIAATEAKKKETAAREAAIKKQQEEADALSEEIEARKAAAEQEKEMAKEEKKAKEKAVNDAIQAEKKKNEQLAAIREEQRLAEEERRLLESEMVQERTDEEFETLREKLGLEKAIRLEARENLAAEEKNIEDKAFKTKVSQDQKKLALEKATNKELIKEQEGRAKEEEKIRQMNLQATQNFIAAGAAFAKEGSIAQKALLTANALISTYTAATQALATPPGPPATIRLAASVTALGLSNVARIQGVGFANGGLLTGGVPGRDSIPLVGQQGELISPRRSFDEVVEGTARQRGFVRAGEGGNAIPILTEIRDALTTGSTLQIGFADDFFEFVENGLRGRRSIGVTAGGAIV